MLVVQKYGGTSVGSVERIKGVANRVAATRAAGHQVAVVVSAMSGETNRLLALAKEVTAQPDERESDVLVSTGEQVTVTDTPPALNTSDSSMSQTIRNEVYTALPLAVGAVGAAAVGAAAAGSYYGYGYPAYSYPAYGYPACDPYVQAC